MKLSKIIDEKGNHQLLYFTSKSVIGDMLVYISDKTGSPNLFCKNIKKNETKQLTFNNERELKSYVYFNGQMYKGFGKASPSLNQKTGDVYYLQGQKICCVNIDGRHREITILPDRQMTGFTHISSDGQYLCVPTVDAEAFEGFEIGKCKRTYIDEKIHQENLSSYLRVFDTRTGEQVLCECVPQCWITHVQFCPIDNNIILYNHEWCDNSGIRRMWLFNGKNHLKLRTESEVRSKDDWTCHEMWQANGEYIIYHGEYKNGIPYVGRVNKNGTDIIEISLPIEYKSYGHFTAGNLHNNWLVSDGYYIHNEAVNNSQKGEWISMQIIDWENGKILWVPLTKHASSWNSQDSHPHPIFDQSDNSVFFTSDKGGERTVYKVDINLE